jgi:PhoH-like ATPase
MTPQLLILDASVLLQDPLSIFRFQRHDIYLPSLIFAKLNQYKVGSTEEARNARQLIQIIDDLLTKATVKFTEGLPLFSHIFGKIYNSQGRLFIDIPLNQEIDSHYHENIVAVIKEKLRENQNITLVTKDAYFRVYGKLRGINVEDYNNNGNIEDTAVLPTGLLALSDDFWQETSRQPSSNQQYKDRLLLTVSDFNAYSWKINQVIYDQNSEYRICKIFHENKQLELEPLVNFYNSGKNIWGIHAKNREQNVCLNFLTNPDIDFITVLGSAGTGKTLLALAAGLAQVFEKNIYKEIIITRNTISIGEDIGFLPGNEEEKMAPWMGALTDNLEILTKNEKGNSWLKLSQQDMIASRIKMRTINFMRGRTFLDRYLIIDEAQNLTAVQLKALITRAGLGTKVICLGNLSQIDTPYLNEISSGLTYVVKNFQNWQHAAHITLQRGERSRLADYANTNL